MQAAKKCNDENFTDFLSDKMYLPPLAQVCDLCLAEKQKLFALMGQDTVYKTAPAWGYSLEPSMYLYTLVIDGKEVDTKRMILTK